MTKKVKYLGTEDIYSKQSNITGKRYFFQNKVCEVDDEDVPDFIGGAFEILGTVEKVKETAEEVAERVKKRKKRVRTVG